MATLTHRFAEPVERCVAAASAKGVVVEARVFDTELPTAKAAAEKLGVAPAQITNSLIFEIKSKGSKLPVLVCAPGDRRIDTKKLAEALGVSKNKIKSASPATVLDVTGYVAGGVGPVGFPKAMHASFVEERCFLHDFVWCGAGIKQAMLRCSPAELLVVTGGRSANLAVEDEGSTAANLAADGDAVSTQLFNTTSLAHDAGDEKMSACQLPAGGPPLPQTDRKEAASDTDSNGAPADSPLPLEDQLSSVGDGALRWFPERAFDFCPGFYRNTGTGERTVPGERLIPTIVIEQDPGHVGGIVWDAEVVLAHHLADVFATTEDQLLPQNAKQSLRGKRVIELGAGTGLAGLVCGLLGAERVVLTELPDALDLLCRNASRTLPPAQHPQDSEGKQHQVSARQRCTVRALSWGEEGVASFLRPAATFSSGGGGDGGSIGLLEKDEGVDPPFDVVLVADCVYLPELYRDLASTVRALSGPQTVVLVAFEQRRRDISAFFAQFDQADTSSDGGGESASERDEGGVHNEGPIRQGDANTLFSSPEHLPGSDGRSPAGTSAAESRRTGAEPRPGKLRGASEASLMRDPRGNLAWVDSPLLQRARELAKVHLAQITFDGNP